MKTTLSTILGIAALTLSSCVNPQTASTSGQNRFGYNGTTTANTDPTPGVQQGVVGDPIPTSAGTGNTAINTTTTSQNTSNDTIALDDLPTNNSSNTASNNTTTSSNNNVATNDNTTTTTNDTTVAEKPEKPEYLYGIPVPGRDGMVYSPYNKDAGYIDVRHMKPGALAEDPYTPGKLFRVP